MAAKTGITPPIYKVVADAVSEFCGGSLSVKNLPAKVVESGTQARASTLEGAAEELVPEQAELFAIGAAESEGK